MTEIKTFLVGFDRFIDIQWAEFALDLAIHSPFERDTQVKELKQYLSVFMSGHDSIRKTANVLTRLWLDTYHPLIDFRSNGFEYYKTTSSPDHLILHWGMSLAVFPLFRNVALQIGKFAHLQGYFRRQELHNRLMEKYSNLGTLPRTIDRIIQTMQNWGTIHQQEDGTYQTLSKPIPHLQLPQWLVEITVYATPQKRILLNDLYRLPELFPFDIQVSSVSQISAQMRIERDGNNLEYLVSRRA